MLESLLCFLSDKSRPNNLKNRTPRNQKGTRRRRRLLPGVENLEDRTLPAIVMSPAALIVQPGAMMPASSTGLPGGFSPAQIRQAYGFNQITFSNGTIQGNGAGQTIAIVDAYNQPNLASDLANFDSTFGIAPPPSLKIVNETGGSALPGADANWGLEESLDVEWAHAIAPGANIMLVEANSANLSDLLSAVSYASSQPGVSTVSMSWGSSEFNGESFFDSYFTTPAGHNGVTFVASSGDGGSSSSPEFPSVSPNVLAVGGTQLTTDSAGDYLSETAWSGSGGGISAYESQPSYQNGVVTQTLTSRTVPDVSYNASSSSPFAVYDTSSYSGWVQVYGTSAGAPQWSALIAIADQGRALAGEGTLDGPSQTLPALYKLPSSDFHDITTGSNGAYSAGTGYDLVTGLGSPEANLIVSGLVGNSTTQTQPPANQPPQVTTPAYASSSTVTGTTTNLGVQATDTAGAASLTYTWSVISEPSGATTPTFNVNGTNAAQNTTATFHQAGSYTFQVTITDPSGMTATSDVSVTVNQTLTSVAITPGSASVIDGTTRQFSVTGKDQFGNVMNSQNWVWSATAGTISSSGLFTAPKSGSGTATIKVSSGSESASATVTFGAAPAVPSNLAATEKSSKQINLTWKESSGTQTGFIIQRSTNGGAWTQIAQVGAKVTSYSDNSVTGGNSYSYRIYAYNSFGNSALSNSTASIKISSATTTTTHNTTTTSSNSTIASLLASLNALIAFENAQLANHALAKDVTSSGSSVQSLSSFTGQAAMAQNLQATHAGTSTSASDTLWQQLGNDLGL